MRASARAGFALTSLTILAVSGAEAQYYGDDGYAQSRPRRVYRYDARDVPPRPPRYAAGLNCDAVQPGLLGAKPFSCPLPGPRPLGARCFCQTPVAPLSGGDTVAGRVVP